MKEVRFSCEAATENAVIYCIENGIEFNTIGRYAMMVEESRAKEVSETEEPATETTPDNITITISKDDSNLYTAKANGVPVGSVNGWFNNTFAACYAVGIKQRKALAMPELIHEDNAAHGFMSEANAVIWLGDMLVRYFRNNGVNAKVVKADKTKSVNSIMNQANRLMSVAGLNLNRVNLIREIAFRYYDNIRECAGSFNYNDEAEFTKPYTRAQYMNA